MRVRSSLTIVASSVFLSLATPAAANEAAEEFLRSWIASVDASPDYRAAFSSITSDAATDTTAIRGLAVASEAPGFALNIDTIAVTGFIPSSDGTFAAASVRLEGAEIGATEFLRIQLASAEFRDFLLPSGTGFAWDDARPFVSFIKALSPLARIEMSTGRIASVVLLQKVDDIVSRITYEQINIDAWSGGRIAAIGAGPITSQSPDVDQLTAMSIASAQSRDVDLNAFLHVYDPDNYVGGAGDRVWHTLVGKTTYRGMIAAMPGVTFTMKDATVEDLRLRQPRGGIDVLATLGPGMEDPSDDPAETLKFLELLTSYGLGALTMNGIEVKAPGVQELRLARLAFKDLSSDVFGEFAIDRLAVSVEDQGTVNIRGFAFGDLVPPSLEALIAAAQAEEQGEEVDVASILPTLGFIEASGVDVALADSPPMAVERFRLDLRDYVGPIPTTVSVDLVDADVDATLIEDADARQMLDALGYDRVVLSTNLRARWTSVGDIIFDTFRFAMADVGTISGNVTVTGLRPTEFMELADEAVIEKLSFVRGTATAEDDSIVGRGLRMQAEQLGVDPEAFREQFAMGLPFMLAFLGDPQLQTELAPVLQQFIKTAGGSLTMVSNPASPLPLLELAMVGMDAPFELLKALNVTFSGIPGVTAPPPEIAAPAEAPEAGEEEEDGSGAPLDLAPEVEDVAPAEDDDGDGGTELDEAPRPPGEEPKKG
jgi:hypothetical protein